MSDMTRRDTTIWAKEEIMDAIDEKIDAIAGNSGAANVNDIDRDEELELKKQRDRVAAFLGLPTKWNRAAPTAPTCGKIVAGWTSGVAPCRLERGHAGRCVPHGAPEIGGGK